MTFHQPSTRYEGLLLEASHAALDELGGCVRRLLAQRDAGLAKVDAMRTSAQKAASRVAEVTRPPVSPV